MGLWYCGMGRRKVNTTVPLEFTCISIQVVLWYCAQYHCTLQKTHPYIVIPLISLSTNMNGPLRYQSRANIRIIYQVKISLISKTKSNYYINKINNISSNTSDYVTFIFIYHSPSIIILKTYICNCLPIYQIPRTVYTYVPRTVYVHCQTYTLYVVH